MDPTEFTAEELLDVFGLKDEPMPSDNEIHAAAARLLSAAQTAHAIQFIKKAEDILLQHAAEERAEEEEGEGEEGEEEEKELNTKSIPVRGVPASRGVLNPIVKNTTRRLVSVDSVYRSSAQHSSTDFVFNLSSILTNVLRLQLYSVQIPHSWYAIPEGHNALWVLPVGSASTPISIGIPAGNYTPATLLAALQAAATTAGLIPPDSAAVIATYNSATQRVRFHLNGWTAASGAAIEKILFLYTADGSGCTSTSRKTILHRSLGWALGFRQTDADIDQEGIAALNLAGPKYFTVVLDDFRQNRIDQGLVTISDHELTPDVPSYHSTSQPYVCGATGVPEILPSAPRTLTAAQIYTLNAIAQDRATRTTSQSSGAPSESDTFAVIPLKSTVPGTTYTEFGSTLQENARYYFGPVTIPRMHIKLLDDRGDQVNLNGLDWSITFVAECLYQF